MTEEQESAMVRVAIRMPETLRRKVKSKAALEGRTISDVVRELLTNWTEGTEQSSAPLSSPVRTTANVPSGTRWKHGKT